MIYMQASLTPSFDNFRFTEISIIIIYENVIYVWRQFIHLTNLQFFEIILIFQF